MNLKNLTFPLPSHETWEITDSTKLQQFMDCPRSYFYTYLLGWRSERPNNHLVFGSAVHLAMEHLYKHGFGADDVITAIDKFNKEYRKEFPEETDELFKPKTPARFIDCLVEYIMLYKNDFNKYEVLYTEVSGSVSLDGYFILYFKMDTILREIAGGLYFSMEHKTKGGDFSGYYGESWKNDFPLSVQVGTYTHALYCMFPPEKVKGVKINGIGMKKTKAHLFDFCRLPIWKSREQMQVWQMNTINWMKQLEIEFEELYREEDSNDVMTAFPMNVRSCTKYNGCPFHNQCLTWANPLKRCEQPPLGMKVEFWDPREQGSEEKVHFNEEGKEVEDV
jgi:hypothetical protein